jgi:hypothetical protein
MKLDEMTHNRQTKSHASVLPAGLLIRLAKSIENVREKLRRNTLTRVAHDDLEM